MAKEILSPSAYDKLSDKQRVFLNGFINLNIWKSEISWDMDQTLAITEDPIKLKCDFDFGTNYKERKIDGYGNISKWLLEDKIFTREKDAKDYEIKVWANNDVLMQAMPNEGLRNLSYVAYQRGIPQSVVTVRPPVLRQSTHKWLDIYFPWIRAGNVNMNIGGLISRSEFKVSTLQAQYQKNPELIHIDDDMDMVRKILFAVPDANIVGLIYPSDDISDININDNRVFMGREELNSRIYYSSQNISDFSRTM